MDSKPIVIGISGISGGGKSTIVRRLSDQLKDSVAVYFDDYTTADTYPADFDLWAANGYDLNEIRSPLLAQHLAALIQGEAVSSPVNDQKIAAADIVLLEAPLGRVQKATGQFIDYLIFIDTPLEIGFARMVQRAVTLPAEANQSSEQLIEQLKGVNELIETYQKWTRHAYSAQRTQVMPECDLVVDGAGSVDDILSAILSGLKSAYGI